jgi:hypothetical protein
MPAFLKWPEIEHHDTAMADGSVRFVSDSISPSGEDGQGLFQINLATDQPTESKTFPSYPGAVFVASGDVNASHHGSSALEGVTDGTSNTLMFHDDLIGWNFTNNTNNPVADGDTGRHSFVFGVELPDAVGLDDGILAAAVGGTAHQGIVIMDNVVEVFYRGDYVWDTAPEADWLLL